MQNLIIIEANIPFSESMICPSLSSRLMLLITKLIHITYGSLFPFIKFPVGGCADISDRKFVTQR